MNEIVPAKAVEAAKNQPVAARSRGSAIVPQNMEEAYRLSQAVMQSGLAPKGLQNPQACMVAIMHGLEIGLPPMQALQRIAVINGRPTLWGDGAMALVRGSGKAKSIKEAIEGTGDNRVAVCLVVRRDDPESPIEGRFSVQDAKTANLWGKSGPWQQFPERMLKMRARAFALRDGFADVLGGMYLTEELQGTETDRPRVMAPGPTQPEHIEQTQTAEAALATSTEPEPQAPLIQADEYDGLVEDFRSRLMNSGDAEVLNEVWDEARSVWDSIMPPDQEELNNAYNERSGAFEG